MFAPTANPPSVYFLQHYSVWLGIAALDEV